MRARTMISALGRVTTLSAACTCLAPTALAEEASRAARAEGLFREAKSLLGERDYARACPLLAASFELDPGTGTLLALAICHEGEGKLASAAAEYRDAAERASTEGRADRERVARERALALESRLSTLAITPPPEAWNTSDFVIRRSGVVVERDAWNKPIALDGGEYVIEASASGKKPWRVEVTLAASTERRALTIPPLENDASTGSIATALPAAPVAPAQPGPKASQNADRGPPQSSEGQLSTLQLVGIGGMVAGAAGVGVGTFYAFQAMSKNDESNENGCDGDTCVGQGKEDRLDARSAGNTATVCFAIGGSLAVGGFIMYLLGATSDDDARQSARTLQPRLSIGPRGVALALNGGF